MPQREFANCASSQHSSVDSCSSKKSERHEKLFSVAAAFASEKREKHTGLQKGGDLQARLGLICCAAVRWQLL